MVSELKFRSVIYADSKKRERKGRDRIEIVRRKGRKGKNWRAGW